MLHLAGPANCPSSVQQYLPDAVHAEVQLVLLLQLLAAQNKSHGLC